MQATITYKNWLIAINRVGKDTIVMAYSKTIPVKEFQAGSIEAIKKLIDQA